MLAKDCIALKPMEESDINEMMKWVNDPEVTQFLERSLLLSREDERKWIRSVAESHTEIVFGIFYIENDEELLIGTCGLHRINWVNRVAGFGIAIGNKKYWEKGIGTTVTKLLIDYAFNQLNMHRISASAYHLNEASIAMQKKCGFKEEGRRREAFFVNGMYADEVILGLLKSDYACGKS